MIYLLLSILFSSGLFVIFKFFEIYKIDVLKAIVVNYVIAFILGFLFSESNFSILEVPKQPWFLGSIFLGILFIADNVNLLLETVFFQMAISLYLVVLFLFMYLILKDSKLIKKGSKLDRYLGTAVIIGILSFLILKLVSIYIIKNKFHSYYFITNYIVVFTTVLIYSFYNFFKHKTLSSKYLLLTLLSLFLSDVFYVINKYYFPTKILVIIACLIELPCYYFLVKYFINRDIEKAKLDNNISS